MEEEEVVKRHAPTLILASVVMMGASLGCSICGRERRVTYLEEKNLIFNPHVIYGLYSCDSRAVWPSTIARDQMRDHVEYRETVIDRQGLYGYTDDYLYRRFDSVRVGRSPR